jgi:lipopolysaccharide heptosyltransferase II
VKRVLLVRLREIGDVALTTPAVRGVRTRFPDAHITYLVEPLSAPVVVTNALIDDVIIAPRRRGIAGVGNEVALIRRLRRERFDLVIDFHGGPRSSLLTWLSGAPVRVGYDVVARGWMYTVRVPRPRELRPRHSVVNQWDLLAALDIPPPDPSTFPMEMPLDPRAAVAVAERLARGGVGPEDPLIVIHVSAGNPFRRWPLDHFTTLVAALASDEPPRHVIVTSGPSDRQAADRVIAAARAALGAERHHRILHGDEFSLAELRALADRAALFIGGDSGPMHIAAASRVPIVVLYGPTLPARSAPWRAPRWINEAAEVEGLPCRPCDQRQCEPGDFRCLTTLHPQRAIEAAHRALARRAQDA